MPDNFKGIKKILSAPILDHKGKQYDMTEESKDRLAHQIDQLTRQERLDRLDREKRRNIKQLISESNETMTRLSREQGVPFEKRAKRIAREERQLIDQILALIPDEEEIRRTERKRILNILEDALENDFVMAIADPEGETRESTIDPTAIREIIQSLKGK